jgi:2-alkenal reductase
MAILIIATLSVGMVLGSVITFAPQPVQGQVQLDEQSSIIRRVYDAINPSVVSLVLRIPADSTLNDLVPFVDPPGDAPRQPGYRYAAGSGFVYNDQGHIVTNAHVVDQADRITVVFADGLTLEATLVASAPDSDLAVIQVDRSLMPDIARPLMLADSDQVRVGERAIAIGNPFGLNGTATQGIISAVGRSLPQDTFRIPGVLQTDAAINPGNSGGPLLNASGEVIGIVTAIRSRVSQSSGVSFAIPSNIIRRVADDIIANGRAQHAFLGILGHTITTSVNRELGLDLNFRGVLVVDVSAGGPAAVAGIRGATQERVVGDETFQLGGDIITAIDGRPIRVFEDLLGYLMTQRRPGDTVTLSILRDGQALEVSVTLTARPAR